MSVLVHVRAQKVLKAVVDLQTWGGHGHPLSHRVTLHVLQVLNALDHLLVLTFSSSSLCRSLRQTPTPLRRPLVILVLAVCTETFISDITLQLTTYTVLV